MAKQRLAELMVRTDATSIAEVIRRSLALYEVLLDYEQEGDQLIVRNSDGKEQPLRLIV